MRHFLRVALLGLLPALAFSLTSGEASSAGSLVAMGKLDPTLRTQLLRRASGLVPLYVKTSDAAKTRAMIKAAGGTTGVLSGNILTARVPAASLTRLAASSSVARMEGARQLNKKLDKVLPAMKVDQVHSGGAGTALKGAGVVIGVVDLGLDVKHGAFKKADGGARVIALWDQGGSGTPPAGHAYGLECNAATLAAGTCGHKATSDHGTHVTGIAAGAPVGGQFTGVAPEADIAFVSVGAFPPGVTDPYEAISTALCDATAYIFDVAKAAGKPAVVNLSLGEHSGPHDGSSLAEQCLDNLSGPGRIIVASAGNEAIGSKSATTTREAVSLHAQLTATGTPTTLPFLASSRGTVDVSVWFDAPSDVSIRIGAQAGASAPVFTNVVKLTSQLEPTTLSVGGKTLGPLAVGADANESGARGFDVRIVDENNDKAELNDVTWLLEVTGTGKVDAYIDTTFGSGFTGAKPAGVTVDGEQTIGYPAIAKEVIAVGSYVTKTQWTPLDPAIGPKIRVDLMTGAPVALGAISSFSSHGPARSNAVVKSVKPDIVAPGETVASALHNDLTVPAQDLVKAKPDGYYVAAGTSIASPAAAGAIALMLQKNPQLTADNVRAIFDATAVVPAGVTKPSTVWGRGQLDALAAVKATPNAGEPLPGTNPSGENPDGGAGTNGAAPPPSDDGCSVAAAPGTSSSSWWLLGLALVLGAIRRERAPSLRA